MRPFRGRRLCIFCPSPSSSGDCQWLGEEILGLSHWAIVMAVGMAPITTKTTWLKLTPVQGLTPCWGLLSKVLGQFLGTALSGLVPQSVKLMLLKNIATYLPIVLIKKEVLTFPISHCVNKIRSIILFWAMEHTLE